MLGIFLFSKISRTVQSAIQALLGAVLNIKPVLELRDGRIEAVEKVRTKQKATQHMLDIVTERVKGKPQLRLAVTHADSENEASSLLESARARLDPVETFSSPLSPVSSARMWTREHWR